MSQINWNHPLNCGLDSWFLCNSATMGGGQEFWNLAGLRNGVITSFDPTTCWKASTATGRSGALGFDGTANRKLDCYSSGLDYGKWSEITISLWVKFTGTQPGSYSALSGRSDNVTYTNWYTYFSTTNPDTLKFYWYPYASVSITSATSPGLNVWRHLLITSSSGDHRLYLDGRLDGSSTTTGTFNSNSVNPLVFGFQTYWSHRFLGEMDCIRVFNRMFTDAEASWEYQETLNYSENLFLPKRRFVSVVPAAGRGPLMDGLRNRIVL